MRQLDNTIERIAPARPPSVRSDVAVPLLQSLVAGVLVGGPLGIGVVAIGADWVVIPGMILVVTGAAWFLRQPVIDRTMWARETRLGVDLNGDGAVGMPEERLVMLNPWRGQAARQDAEREAQEARVAEFVRDAFTNTSMAFLEGRGYDRSTEIQVWRDALMRSGWARWRSDNHRHGWEFCEGVMLDEVLASLVVDYDD